MTLSNPNLQASINSGRLGLNQVRFLVFEGGGGKGFAYLGALRTLECLGILRFDGHQVSESSQVRGFAGSSAGAITALLLSCGYSPTAIEMMLGQVNFSKFFDKPRPGVVPDLYGFKQSGQPRATVEPMEKEKNPCLPDPKLTKTESKAEGNIYRQLLFAGLKFIAAPAIIVEAALGFASTVVAAEALAAIGLISWPILSVSLSEQPPPTNLVVNNVQSAGRCLVEDWGIFCGDKFHRAFGRIIQGAVNAKRAKSIDLEPDYSFIKDDEDKTKPELERGSIKPNLKMTFKEHEEEFGVKLGVMGTDLSSHKSVFFSPDTTPDFPVAAAVRISMGLPLVFKPMVLDAAKAELFVGEMYREGQTHVYVDGGLFNNVPLTVVDAKWGEKLPDKRGAVTLALRLGEEMPASIDSFAAFLKSWLVDTGAFGSGESQIHRTLGTDDRTILLKTDGLDLLNFGPPSEECAKYLANCACSSVCEYFGVDPSSYCDGT